MSVWCFIRPLFVMFIFGLLTFLSDNRSNPPTTYSQDGGNNGACSTLMDDALSTMGSACAEVGINEACYGNILVSATLNDDTDAQFQTSGDIISLDDIQALFTQPANPDDGTWGLALLTVQADLPTYSGASITYVLFGDTQIQDASTLTETPEPVTCDISNTGSTNINMRGGPSTNDQIINVFGTGQTAIADGRTESGDWIHVNYNNTDGWLYTSLIDVACDVQNLAVTDTNAPSQVTYTHMQAITLQSGESPACDRSPDGLLIRSPEGRRARIIVNGVQLTMSSAGFLTAQPDGDLMLQGLEGSIEVTSAGQTVTVTDGVFTTVPLDGLQAVGPPTLPQPINPNTDLPALDTANTSLANNSIGTPSCTFTSSATVISRTGPNEQFPPAFEVQGDIPIAVTGTYSDGDTIYYRVTGGGWVPDQNATLAGNCANLPDIVADTEDLPRSGTWSMKVTVIPGECDNPPSGPEDPNFRFRLIITFSDDRSTMGYNDGLSTGTQTYTRIDDMTYINNTYGAARLVFTSPTTFIETFSGGDDPCSFRSIDEGYYVGP